MTDNASHLGATLQDLLDERLDAARQTEVLTHLAGCPQCRSELEALRWVRDVALKQLPVEDVPPALAARVVAALDVTDKQTVRRGWRRRTMAAAVLAAAAVVLLLLVSPSSNGDTLPNAVARDFVAYRDGTLPLTLHTSDVAAVERFFVAGGAPFAMRAFDLGMMQYQLVGGRLHRLRGRPSALFVYSGPGDRNLVCQMYEGQLADLPRSDDVREHNGITFRVYRAGTVTLVFWQEGPVVCVLASDADAEAVIQLAYAKAVKV